MQVAVAGRRQTLLVGGGPPAHSVGLSPRWFWRGYDGGQGVNCVCPSARAEARLPTRRLHARFRAVKTKTSSGSRVRWVIALLCDQ